MSRKTLFEKYINTKNYKKKMAIMKQIRFRENIFATVILAFAIFGFGSLVYFVWLYLSSL